MVVTLATPDQLPIIDISPLYDNDSPAEQKTKVVAAIRGACLNTGFFYVSGQQLPHTAGIFKCMQQLFDLPEASKERLDANLSPLHRGWTGLGGSHNCVPEETAVKGPDNKESYLLGKHRLAVCVTSMNSSISPAYCFLLPHAAQPTRFET